MTESQSFRVVIPARLESSRLPRKVLREIAGKPMLQHVFERSQSAGAEALVVATDNDEIAAAARDFGADVAMTEASHTSGTERVAQVARDRGWDDDLVIVNVQGDVPLVPPQSIRQVAGLVTANPSAAIGTLCTPVVSEEEFLDPNVVKVVADQQGRALYFSRSSIPSVSHATTDSRLAAQRHIGLYAYRSGALQELASASPCQLEQTERLEQLRAMWLGMEIRVAESEVAQGPDVDTEADLAAVEQLLASGAL